jgi:tetratricopeptide (TPR) repeat protein
MRPVAHLGLLLFVLIGLYDCKCQDTVKVEFPIRQPDPKQVDRVRDREKKEISGYQPGELEQGVLESYLQFNRNTLAKERPPADLEQDLTRIRVAAKMCLEQGGQKQLHQLIIWLLVRFEQSLADLLVASKTHKAAAALLSGSEPPDGIREQFEKFARLGGDFIPNAYNAGLIRRSKDDGLELAEDGRFFVRLAFKVRWAKILPQAIQPMTWLLNGFESKWYDIWTVERSRTASLSRKLKAIARLKKRNPAYRDHQARGIVYYQKKDFKRAALSFEQALKENPKDRQVGSFLKAARRRL